MDKKKITTRLIEFARETGLPNDLNMSADNIAEYLYKHISVLAWLRDVKLTTQATGQELNLDCDTERKVISVDNDANEFVERMYTLYPTKCPKRNTSLGKSRKDKVKIKRLLKTYTQEEIELVIRHEVDSNYGVNYMKNFSTFLNNFPDPNEGYAIAPTVTAGNTTDKLIIGGVEYK
jgi:hypothetical protein